MTLFPCPPGAPHSVVGVIRPRSASLQLHRGEPSADLHIARDLGTDPWDATTTYPRPRGAEDPS